MNTPWHVEDLEIVGYAEVLKETMLPSVVPPVFRVRAEPGRLLLPPYSFNGGYLCNAAEVGPAELEDLRARREITLFDASIPARPAHELWVDQTFAWRYEPRGVAEDALGRIATGSIERAEAALRRGDIELAERLSGVAASADDRRVEPFAIKAAIRRIQGNPSGERLMAELAAPVLEDRLFILLVDCYARLPDGKTPPVHTLGIQRRPMKQVAELRATAIA